MRGEFPTIVLYIERGTVLEDSPVARAKHSPTILPFITHSHSHSQSQILRRPPHHITLVSIFHIYWAEPHWSFRAGIQTVRTGLCVRKAKADSADLFGHHVSVERRPAGVEHRVICAPPGGRHGMHDALDDALRFACHMEAGVGEEGEHEDARLQALVQAPA